MKIYSVNDREFSEYGRVIAHDNGELLTALHKMPCPKGATTYEPSVPELEAVPEFAYYRDTVYGGMPVQIGFCSGENVMLNCLEYHMDSEVNVAETDVILLLAKRSQVENGLLDTSLIKAFLVPAGTAVEMYATSMHYAPCKADGGFRVAVVLPKGTNTEKPQGVEDKLLLARNKWLYAHPDTAEAKNGAYVGLTGENLSIL